MTRIQTKFILTQVKTPIVNVEEKIDRIVGRRKPGYGNLEARFKIQETGLEMQRAFDHRWRVHGVFKFKSHEEADEWMLKMMARSAQKTS